MPHTLPQFVCAMFLLLKSIVSGAFVSTAAATAGWDRCHRSLDCQSLPLVGLCCHVLLDCQLLPLTGFSFHPRQLPPLAGLRCHVLPDCQSLQLTGGSSSPLQASPRRDQFFPQAFPLAFPPEGMAKGRDANYTTLSTERMRVRSCIYLRNSLLPDNSSIAKK